MKFRKGDIVLTEQGDLLFVALPNPVTGSLWVHPRGDFKSGSWVFPDALLLKGVAPPIEDLDEAQADEDLRRIYVDHVKEFFSRRVLP